MGATTARLGRGAAIGLMAGSMWGIAGSVGHVLLLTMVVLSDAQIVRAAPEPMTPSTPVDGDTRVKEPR
jgi:hypothetical protein